MHRLRPLLVLIACATPLPAGDAVAQQCSAITNLASCPPCPASPRCRRARPDFMPTQNGCGPQKFSKLIDNGVIPQGFGDADFRNGGCAPPAVCGCNQHDVCYGTCNANKAACDSTFAQEMIKECRRKYPATKNDCPDGLCFSNQDRLGICLSRARLYFRAVSGGGQGAYDDAQKEACECCEVPAGMTYCFCNKKCYPNGTMCLAECKVSLACNTGICGPATPEQCPPP
jgi:hypothetical protein